MRTTALTPAGGSADDPSRLARGDTRRSQIRPGQSNDPPTVTRTEVPYRFRGRAAATVQIIEDPASQLNRAATWTAPRVGLSLLRMK
jgi:hypothetical protein